MKIEDHAIWIVRAAYGRCRLPRTAFGSICRRLCSDNFGVYERRPTAPARRPFEPLVRGVDDT